MKMKVIISSLFSMVFRQISPDLKQRALQLLDQGIEIGDIVDWLGVSTKSVTRWQNSYDQHVRVDPLSGIHGRPRILSADVVNELQEILTRVPDLYLSEMADWLALHYNLAISTSALHKHLQDLGYTRKLMHRAAAERDEALRAAWRHDVLANYTAEQLVVLDESSKDGRTLYRQYGRARFGEQATGSTPLERGI